MQRQEGQEQVHGGDIYRHQNVTDFSVNSNPLGPPEAVIEALREGAGQIHHYPDVECEKLREAIGAFEQVPPEEILCGNGAAELFFAAVFAERPRRGLLTAPAFAEYGRALQAVGAKSEFYPLREEDQFQVGEDFLERITPKTDLVFLCSPNNPTGQPIRRSLIRKVLEKCEACGARLILDECFLDFLEAPKEYEALELKKDHPQMLVVKAFTKTFAMPGVRLGYGISGDREFLGRMRTMLQPWNVSLLAQAGGAAALNNAEAYLAKTRQVVAREREYLRRNLEDLGFQVYGSQANYLFFRGREGLYREALEAGFLIRDCGNYRELGPGYYRIAVRKRAENERLIEWLRRS